jgi:hypothetical protein
LRWEYPPEGAKS